jgi:hypothetical protein
MVKAALVENDEISFNQSLLPPTLAHSPPILSRIFSGSLSHENAIVK